MILIGDSSALIALSTCNALELLVELFSRVFVPQAVYDEICGKNKRESMALEVFLKDRVVPVVLEDYLVCDFSLGQGELEAIALCKKLKADRVLIDDKRARKLAKLNGINTIGSLGVLLTAKERGLIQQITPYIEKLEHSDIYIKKNLLEYVIRLSGE